MEAERQQENWNELTKDITMGLVEEHFLESIDPEPSFCEYLDRLCEQTGKKRWQVIANSGIDRTYGYQLFNGTRKPSRDKAIQLAIGFELNVDQTQELLRAAEKNTLEPRKKRDAAVLFCLAREMDVENTQKLLERHELEPLGQFERQRFSDRQQVPPD